MSLWRPLQLKPPRQPNTEVRLACLSSTFRLSVLFRSPITSELSFIHIFFLHFQQSFYLGDFQSSRVPAFIFSVFVILDNSILGINLVYLKWMLGLFMLSLHLYQHGNILLCLQINLFSLLSCFLSEIQKLLKKKNLWA